MAQTDGRIATSNNARLLLVLRAVRRQRRLFRRYL